MNKFAVNLSTIFTEVPFLDRFKKAKDCGFSYVECQFPYANSIDEIKDELKEHKLSMVLLNLPPGNWEKGDRGIAVNPDRKEEFKRSVEDGIKYATALKVSTVHCMAGIASGNDPDAARRVYIENLQYAATELAKHGLTMVIEPINPFDMPGYYLNDIYQAEKILNTVGLQNVKLQFDFYHMERVHGMALSVFEEYFDRIGHVQIADFPGRHQPGTGNMDYQAIFQYLKDTYKGYIGLEYTPLGKSEDSFKWVAQIGKRGE